MFSEEILNYKTRNLLSEMIYLLSKIFRDILPRVAEQFESGEDYPLRMAVFLPPKEEAKEVAVT